MTVVRSVVFTGNVFVFNWGWKLFCLLVWLFCWNTGFASLLYGQISVIHKLYQQGLCCRGARRKEWSCEDNENSGIKPCLHVARSPLPGDRAAYSSKFYAGKLRPEIQPLTPLYTIFDRLGSPLWRKVFPLWNEFKAQRELGAWLTIKLGKTRLKWQLACGEEPSLLRRTGIWPLTGTAVDKTELNLVPTAFILQRIKQQ